MTWSTLHVFHMKKKQQAGLRKKTHKIIMIVCFTATAFQFFPCSIQDLLKVIVICNLQYVDLSIQRQRAIGNSEISYNFNNYNLCTVKVLTLIHFKSSVIHKLKQNSSSGCQLFAKLLKSEISFIKIHYN